MNASKIFNIYRSFYHFIIIVQSKRALLWIYINIKYFMKVGFRRAFDAELSMCLSIGCPQAPAFSVRFSLSLYIHQFFVFLCRNANTCSETFTRNCLRSGQIKKISLLRALFSWRNFAHVGQEAFVFYRAIIWFRFWKNRVFSGRSLRGCVFWKVTFVGNFHCFPVVFHQNCE